MLSRAGRWEAGTKVKNPGKYQRSAKESGSLPKAMSEKPCTIHLPSLVVVRPVVFVLSC